jgi:predicted DNA-binding transcriptional regulator AlpA
MKRIKTETTTWLTAGKVAGMIGISLVTLGRWRDAGRGPAYTSLGERLHRYRAVDVEAWLAAHRVAAGQEVA